MLKEILVEILASRVARHMGSAIDRVLPHLYPKKAVFAYKRELKGRLAAMPFIYIGREAQVLENYVEVEIQPRPDELEIFIEGRGKHQSTAGHTQRSKVDPDDQLMQKKKVLILGNAGIGKTTFVRHTILTLLNGAKSKYFFSKEKPIPIYIPLKAVDNSAPSPILAYIFENCNLFNFPSGPKRFLSLAEKWKLWLILDGYDEIPFPTSVNFVQNELQFLILPDKDKLDRARLKKEWKDIYFALASKCRIWLTSRREFFHQHSITLPDPNVQAGSLLIDVQGIGNNRKALASRIFSLHGTPRSKQTLDPDVFLAEIDQGPGEFATFSHNPLFLTIMCYVYANLVERSRSPTIKWVTGIRELIDDCTDLLLEHLDAKKTDELRDKPRKHLALGFRKGGYIREKKLFLWYFSACLYLKKINIFNIPVLTESARQFFAERSDLEASPSILAGLSKSYLSKVSIQTQLINSGLFVLVDRGQDGELYDFPHRRFRESYAIEFLESETTLEKFRSLILDRSGSELVSLFISTSDRRLELLDLLLREISASKTSDLYLSRLLKVAIKSWPGGHHAARVPSSKFREFLIVAARNNSHFFLEDSLLEYCRDDSEFIAELLMILMTPTGQHNVLAHCLLCEILATPARPTVRSALEQKLTSGDPWAGALAIKYLLRLSSQFFWKSVPGWIRNPAVAPLLVRAVFSSSMVPEDAKRMVKELEPSLNPRQLGILIQTIRTKRSQLFSILSESGDLYNLSMRLQKTIAAVRILLDLVHSGKKAEVFAMPPDTSLYCLTPAVVPALLEARRKMGATKKPQDELATELRMKMRKLWYLASEMPSLELDSIQGLAVKEFGKIDLQLVVGISEFSEGIKIDPNDLPDFFVSSWRGILE